MTIGLKILFLFHVLFVFGLYIRLQKKKATFTDRYRTTISFHYSMILPFVLALLLAIILPLSFSSLAILSIILGKMVGILFGSLGKLHSIFTGVSSGIIGGLTGAMIGMVILDPSLCGLPSVSAQVLTKNVVTFSTFASLLHVISSLLVYHCSRDVNP